MKYLLLFLCASFLNYQIGNAQFFGRLNKIQPPTGTNVTTYGIRAHTVTISLPLTDSIFGAIRPITVPVAYGLPGNNVMAGVGAAYQRLDYNYGTQLYTTKWEVGILGFGGINAPAPNDISAIATVAIMGGLPIGGIPFLAGPAYFINAPVGKHFGAAISVSISFNN